jgi:drug/metabolite transporter (DMT)-like permease
MVSKTAVGSSEFSPRIEKAGLDRRFWIILALLTVYIVWGTTYLAIAWALESYPPYLMMGIRFVIAGAILFVMARMRGGAIPTLKQTRNAGIIGVLLLVGGMGSVAIAEQWVSSGLVALLIATAPVVAMVLSVFWGSRPRSTEWIGVVLGMIGVGLLAFEGNLRANPLGFALVLFATVSWSFGSLLSKRIELPEGSMGNAAEMLIGGAILVLLGLLRGEMIAETPTLRATLALVHLITFGSLAAITAYMYLLKNVQPSLALSYAFVNPAIALGLGVLLGGETITGSALISLPVILIGVAFVAFRKKSEPEAKEAVVEA